MKSDKPLNISDKLGAILLTLVAVALLTGLLLLPFYHPTANAAHNSVSVIARSAPLSLLRALHHWASALIIIFGGLWIFYGLLVAAYRRPRQVIWIASIGLVVAGLLLQLTGHLLPWDTHAVRTAAIETGIAANAPLIGPLQARLLRGGSTVGPHTLTLWYLAHILLLPVGVCVVSGLALWQRSRLGIRLAPSMLAVAASLLLLALLAVAFMPRLGPAAAAGDYGSYDAPPEWYVLPLHSLLVLFQSIRSDLAFVGTMVLPGLALALLLALPWLDRKPAQTAPSLPVQAAAALGAICFIALVMKSASNMAPLTGGWQLPASSAAAAMNPAQPAVTDPALVTLGKRVYADSGCANCHQLGGQGGSIGPALDGTGTRHPDPDWQMRHLRAPSAVVPGSTMPSFAHLSASDLKALANYLASLK